MAASLPTKTTVILDGPSDWDEWIFLINSKAQDGDVESPIDLNATEEPPRLREPTEPEITHVKAAATSLADLSAGEREMYKILRDEYRTKLARYERKRVALIDIKNHILSTVSRQNLSYILDKQTPWQILTALQKRLAPTDCARKIELTRRYFELKNPPQNQQIDI